MRTTGEETPASGSEPDPALYERLQDPVFTRAFDDYRDLLVRRALWASAGRRGRKLGGRDRITLAG
jgi:hypothetical protein